MRDMEDKLRSVAVNEAGGEGVSTRVNGANGMSDIEGKAARVAVNEPGDDEFQTQARILLP